MGDRVIRSFRIALGILAGFALLAGCGGGHAVSHSSAAVSHPSVVSAPAAGNSAVPQSCKQQVNAWITSSAVSRDQLGTAIGNVGNDATTLGNDINTRAPLPQAFQTTFTADIKALIRSDLKAGGDKPPACDSKLGRDYAAWLDALQGVGVDLVLAQGSCNRGDWQGAAIAYNQSATYFTNGSNDLKAVQIDIGNT